MTDKRLIEIKERILQYAMGLWGITDFHNMDPVVDLLLDVFAYESTKLHHEVENSNSRILYRLSQILVDNKWSLPTPAHALMSVNPNYGEACMLDAEEHFYAEKFIFGKESAQVFFTPLFSYPLIDARLRLIAHGSTIRSFSDKLSVSTTFLRRNEQIASYSLWLGIAIEKEQLDELKEITFCLIPQEASQLAFLKMVRFYDYTGKKLQVEPGLEVQDPFKNAYYFDDIKRYYNDYYFNVIINDASKECKTVSQLFPASNLHNQEVNVDGRFFWLKMELPEIFDPEQINSLNIYINTFPVVNRKLVYKQHNFVSNGRIIPLPCPKSTYFLNIRSILDNSGKEYTNRLHQYEEAPTGIFSLYFGDLERFNSDDATSLIAKTLQRIKEDGNAFASMNPDTLATQLKELFSKLNEVEKALGMASKDEKRQNVFALTMPEPNATNAEIKYWITAGALANGFDERTFVQQFNMEKYDPTSIVLRTRTQGGIVHLEESDLINSLRYGLVSRDRIVSKEDIRNYIFHKIGKYAKSVQVCEGVAISPERKKGFIRVTQVEIKLNQHDTDISDLSALAHFLEKDLAERSICNSSYKIVFL